MSALKWLFASAFLVACLSHSALAHPQYRAVLEAESKDKKIEPAVKELKCNFCHVDKKPKKIRNTYGKALEKVGVSEAKYKELKEDKEKLADYIKQAMEAAAAETSPSGKTFGELIEAGEAPGTSPEP